MKKRGQVSIEFIFLVVFMVTYITTSVMPTMAVTDGATQEVARLGNAKIAAQKLADAIETIDSSPVQAKKTIQLFVPEKTQIECNPGQRTIEYESEMENRTPNPKPCPNSGDPNCCEDIGGDLYCRGIIQVGGSTNFSCAPIGGPVLKEVTVEKNPGGGNIDITEA
ncbi:MAG: hypothetical protein JW772_03785 [Candidatus Diapherotrites archaeon]|nr:hypothetical protein [Candidatus Diapherotrites archaeon]